MNHLLAIKYFLFYEIYFCLIFKSHILNSDLFDRIENYYCNPLNIEKYFAQGHGIRNKHLLIWFSLNKFGGWVFETALKMLLGTPVSHIRMHDSNVTFLLMCSWWSLNYLLCERPRLTLGSWLWPGAALHVVGIWGVSEMIDLSLSLSLSRSYPPVFQIKLK